MDGEASSDSNSCQEIENLDSEPQMHSIITESKEEEEEEEESEDIESSEENESSKEKEAGPEEDSDVDWDQEVFAFPSLYL